MNWHEILDGGIGGLVVFVLTWFFCRNRGKTNASR